MPSVQEGGRQPQPHPLPCRVSPSFPPRAETRQRLESSSCNSPAGCSLGDPPLPPCRPGPATPHQTCRSARCSSSPPAILQATWATSLSHVLARGKRSERHPTPRGCSQLNKREPSSLPAHSVSLGRRCPPGGGSAHGVEKVWGGGNPLGAGGSSGSSSVCLGLTLCLLPSLVPPALSIYASTRLEGWSFSGQQRWNTGGSGTGSFKEGLPHTCPLHTQPCWGPQNPTPTQLPLTLGPQCQASPCSSHPGPGLATGVPLVSGLLSAQQQLFLLWPQRIPWDPLPRPWVPPRCQRHPSLSHDRFSQRDQSPRPCLPFTSPGPLFLMPTALQPLALYRTPEMSWRAPRRKEAGPGAPVPGRGCWEPGCCGGASGRGCQVGRMVQGCCGCWAFVLLNGGAGVGLSLQAPVWGVEEEHQEAAEEDAEAGHQQHGHWGDTAQHCLRRPKRRGTRPGARDPRAASGTDPHQPQEAGLQTQGP